MGIWSPSSSLEYPPHPHTGSFTSIKAQNGWWGGTQEVKKKKDLQILNNQG
jgi:hypothetical protein